MRRHPKHHFTERTYREKVTERTRQVGGFSASTRCNAGNILTDASINVYRHNKDPWIACPVLNPPDLHQSHDPNLHSQTKHPFLFTRSPTFTAVQNSRLAGNILGFDRARGLHLALSLTHFSPIAKSFAMTSINGAQIIGQQLSEQGAEVFHGEQGSTGRVLEPEFRNATSSEIQQAVLLAHQAQTPWAHAAPATRASFLRHISLHIDNHQKILLERAALETGYSAPRLTMELNRSRQQLEIFARFIEEGSWVDAVIDQGDPYHPSMPLPDMRRMLRPLGPVGVFGASNFPFAISVIGNDAVAAWAAGCPVVVKAHPGHPGTCELLGQLRASSHSRTQPA